MRLRRGKGYKVTRDAVEQAVRIGIFGDTEARLLRMLRRSAVHTGDYGNRRFGNFILQTRENTLLSISKL